MCVLPSVICELPVPRRMSTFVTFASSPLCVIVMSAPVTAFASVFDRQIGTSIVSSTFPISSGSL